MIGVTSEELTVLKKLEKAHGVLTPSIVLESALDPESPLHRRFTWDDEEAAKLHRLDEARTLIMSVRVKMIARPDEPPISVRAFVSLDSDRIAEGGYRSIDVVMSDETMRGQLLRTAIGELQLVQKRYRHLSELAQVFAALETVQQKAG